MFSIYMYKFSWLLALIYTLSIETKAIFLNNDKFDKLDTH